MSFKGCCCLLSLPLLFGRIPTTCVLAMNTLNTCGFQVSELISLKTQNTFCIVKSLLDFLQVGSTGTASVSVV